MPAPFVQCCGDARPLNADYGRHVFVRDRQLVRSHPVALHQQPSRPPLIQPLPRIADQSFRGLYKPDPHGPSRCGAARHRRRSTVEAKLAIWMPEKRSACMVTLSGQLSRPSTIGMPQKLFWPPRATPACKATALAQGGNVHNELIQGSSSVRERGMHDDEGIRVRPARCKSLLVAC